MTPPNLDSGHHYPSLEAPLTLWLERGLTRDRIPFQTKIKGASPNQGNGKGEPGKLLWSILLTIIIIGKALNRMLTTKKFQLGIANL